MGLNAVRQYYKFIDLVIFVKIIRFLTNSTVNFRMFYIWSDVS